MVSAKGVPSIPPAPSSQASHFTARLGWHPLSHAIYGLTAYPLPGVSHSQPLCCEMLLLGRVLRILHPTSLSSMHKHVGKKSMLLCIRQTFCHCGKYLREGSSFTFQSPDCLDHGFGL